MARLASETKQNKENEPKSTKRGGSKTKQKKSQTAAMENEEMISSNNKKLSPEEKLRQTCTNQFEIVQAGGSEKRIQHSATIVQKLEESLGTEHYIDMLLAHIKPVLLSPAGSGNSVYRLMRLVSLVTIVPSKEVSENEMDEDGEGDDLGVVAIKTLELCIQQVDSQNKQVRLRACELINYCLQACEEKEISSFVFDTLVEIMLVRAYDKNAGVRIQALKTLHRLQDPDDDEEEDGLAGWNDVTNAITDVFINAASSDNSPEVRKAAIELMPPTEQTLKIFLRRCLDIKDSVRLSAFDVLGKKTGINDVPRADRLHVIKTGLTDRCPAVYKSCSQMLCNWLAHKNNCCLTLLHFLHVENHEEMALNVMNAIFEVNKEKLEYDIENLNLDDLTPAAAIYWRSLCSYAQKINHEKEDEILPNISELCDLIQSYQSKLFLLGPEEKKSIRMVNFVITQLLHIAAKLDLSDEVGRQRLSDDVRRMICAVGTPQKLMEPLASCIEHLHPENGDRSVLLFNLLNEIDTNLNEGNNTESLPKRLEVAALFFERFSIIQTNDEEVAQFIEFAILKGITNGEPRTRLLAVKCLGLCCLSDLDLTKQYLPLFLQILQNDLQELREVTLKILFDFLLNFGPAALGQKYTDDELFDPKETHSSEDEENSTETCDFVLLLVQYLNVKDDTLQALANEGFAKLLINGRIKSSKIVQELILNYYNPITEDNTRLRQCLSVFFPAFAFSSFSHQEMITEIFLTTLHTIFDASQRSPLFNVKAVELGQFLVYLTASSNLIVSDESIRNKSCHDSMAIEILKEIYKYQSFQTVQMTRLFCRLLGLLHIKNVHCANLTGILVAKLKENITDKVSEKSLDRFILNLENCVEEYENETDDEKVQNEEQDDQEQLTDKEDNTMQDVDEKSHSEELEKQGKTIIDNNIIVTSEIKAWLEKTLDAQCLADVNLVKKIA